MTAAHCFQEVPTAYVEVVSPSGTFNDKPAFSDKFTVNPRYSQFASPVQLLSSDVAVVFFARKTATPDLIVQLASTAQKPATSSPSPALASPSKTTATQP